MKHVSCIVHFVHNLVCKIFEFAPTLKNCINLITETLKNSPQRKKLLNEYVKSKVPSTPIAIRFVSTLSYATFMFNNWQDICKFFSIETIEANSFKACKEFIIKNKDSIESELIHIQNFSYVVGMLKWLESRNLSVFEVFSSIKGVINDLSKHNTNKKIIEYINNWLNRTADNKFFYDYSPLRCSNEEKIHAYAPMNSIEVERSFSSLNYICTSKKIKMKNNMLFALMSIYWNKKE